MNIAEYSIRNSVVTWVVTIALLVVGYMSFQQLSRLEDPEFTIKDAIVLTPYPGASPQEVEEEVTNQIESAAQELGQVKRVESRSSRGLSYVKVSIKDKYDKNGLPQVWDELRRKVNDYQRKLPPGAGPSIVNDDFGDVYGVYIVLTGDGYELSELYEVAKMLQVEILRVQDVKRVSILANVKETIYVEMKKETMAQLGISPDQIYGVLAQKNLVSPSGRAVAGVERVPLNPTGEIVDIEDLGRLLIRGQGSSARAVYLGDVATVVRDYETPPASIVRYDGVQGIGLGISTVAGGNVVTMGEALDKRLRELLGEIPLGIEFGVVSLQSEAVTIAIDAFMKNLMVAVAIVVVVLLIFMGLRSGLIIGFVLAMTIMGSFIIMQTQDVILERISLGALIIALGMLVDNAIVVTDGMRIRMQGGMSGMDAAREVVGQTATPLLGATVIAILAFGAIGLSQDATGEYCRSLFTVVMISLGLSWFTAVTTTPLLCATFLPVGSADAGEKKDPYGSALYRGYRRFLEMAIRMRWVTLAVVVAMFVGAVIGFGSIKKSFFPSSTRPQFMVDVWLPEGTRIETTAEKMRLAEEHVLAIESVTHVTTYVGGGHTRFLLTYVPEKPWEAYAQMLVDVDDYKQIADLMPRIEEGLGELLPDTTVIAQPFVLGPGEPGKIRVRVSGPDPVVLRELAGRAEEILRANPRTKYVRNDWRDRVKVLRPRIAEAQARDLGLERPQIAEALSVAVEGQAVGVFRERDELYQIVARAPESERSDFHNLDAARIWSPASQRYVPLGQVVTGFDLTFEDPYIWRRHRQRTITVFADVAYGLPSELLAEVKVPIEQALDLDLVTITGSEPKKHTAATVTITDDGSLPLDGFPGYSMAWGGEAEDSARAGGGLAKNFPPILGMMVFVVIFLFNSMKKTAIVWLVVPLALIGVTVGLLSTNQPFGFMALLGLLSLIGMLIKNAIVLIDEIGALEKSKDSIYEAIVGAGMSRLIPVMMAAGTTMLGLIPLFADAFFIAMAVTIVFGLFFATILTLVVVPVLYAVFFRVPSPSGGG